MPAYLSRAVGRSKIRGGGGAVYPSPPVPTAFIVDGLRLIMAYPSSRFTTSSSPATLEGYPQYPLESTIRTVNDVTAESRA